MLDLSGKVALVTGGSGGLGLEFAKRMLRAKAKGVCLADVKEEDGSKAARDLCETYGEGKGRAKSTLTCVSR